VVEVDLLIEINEHRTKTRNKKRRTNLTTNNKPPHLDDEITTKKQLKNLIM
jgi:hypothetical protein